MLGLFAGLLALGLAGTLMLRAVFGRGIWTFLLIACAGGLLLAFKPVAIMAGCAAAVWGITRLLPKGSY